MITREYSLAFLELVLCGPVLLVGLARTRDGEGHGRDIIGDGGACGGVSALAHRDRRDQIGVAADEGVVADGRAVFFRAVIVDRDSAAAEVDVFAYVSPQSLSPT